MSFFMVEALQLFMLLHSKPLQLNVCFSLTPACKIHTYFFWVTSPRKAKEGNEGGNSWNFHWRYNCRNSQQWFHHSSTPSKVVLLQPPPLSLAFTLRSSAQHRHTSICVANSFGCSTAESFLTLSFVRTVRFSAGLTYLTRLTVWSDKQECQYKRESSDRLKGTEQEQDCNSNQQL